MWVCKYSQSLPKSTCNKLAQKHNFKENLLFKGSLKEPYWLVGAHISLSREELPGLSTFNSDPREACPLGRTHLNNLVSLLINRDPAVFSTQNPPHPQKCLQDAPKLTIK